MIHDPTTTALANKIQKLEEEKAILEEQIAYLSAALVPHKFCPPEWNLSGSEARILLAIEAKQFATADDLMAALYWDKPEPAIPQAVHVFMSRVRKKMKPFGVEIMNLHGQGFYLTPKARDSLRRQRGEA